MARIVSKECCSIAAMKLSAPHDRIPVLIDCDPGIDDALALMVAAKYTAIAGITTVAGNVPIEHTTNNALSLCELLDLRVPVHQGAAGPLEGDRVTAEHVHGDTGLGDLRLSPPTTQIRTDDAVAFLNQHFLRNPGTRLITLGPLTNVALLLRHHPRVAEYIGGITFMGGSAFGSGNVTASAEFNIFADPEAADIVFKSTVPLEMVGLNLTHQVLMGEQHGALLDKTNPIGSAAITLLKSYQHLIASGSGVFNVPMHDPCAVLAVSHRELFGFKSRHVMIELQGDLTRGQTVVDERRTSREANMDVAYDVDIDSAITAIQFALS